MIWMKLSFGLKMRVVGGKRVRIVNLSSYIQDKFQQTAHLRIISDDDCSCGN